LEGYELIDGFSKTATIACQNDKLWSQGASCKSLYNAYKKQLRINYFFKYNLCAYPCLCFATCEKAILLSKLLVEN